MAPQTKKDDTMQSLIPHKWDWQSFDENQAVLLYSEPISSDNNPKPEKTKIKKLSGFEFSENLLKVTHIFIARQDPSEENKQMFNLRLSLMIEKVYFNSNIGNQVISSKNPFNCLLIRASHPYLRKSTATFLNDPLFTRIERLLLSYKIPHFVHQRQVDFFELKNVMHIIMGPKEMLESLTHPQHPALETQQLQGALLPVPQPVHQPILSENLSLLFFPAIPNDTETEIVLTHEPRTMGLLSMTNQTRFSTQVTFRDNITKVAAYIKYENKLLRNISKLECALSISFGKNNENLPSEKNQFEFLWCSRAIFASHMVLRRSNLDSVLGLRENIGLILKKEAAEVNKLPSSHLYHMAASVNKIFVIQEMIKLGFDIHEQWDSTGQNSFHVGLVCQWPKIVLLSLEKKISQKTVNIWQLTPEIILDKLNNTHPIKQAIAEYEKRGSLFDVYARLEEGESIYSILPAYSYALTILLSDDYFKLNQQVDTESEKKTVRYFQIATRLSNDMQMVFGKYLCRSGGLFFRLNQINEALKYIFSPITKEERVLEASSID